MGKIYVDFDRDVPRYACSYCNNCTSIMGQSLFSINNRGCCWYSPKFTLLDIQRMIKTLEGIHVFELIKRQPGTVVNDYYLHAKGFFDKNGYEKWLKENTYIEKPVEDCSIFFRACPFVKKGLGCSLPPRFRTVVCNFFVCHDIFGRSDMQDTFKQYFNERTNYAAWVEWENQYLERLLKGNNITLRSDLEAATQILRDTPLDIYEFPMLDPIDMDDGWNDTFNKGA